MAPEQVQDAGSVDIRADIYALGGTFYWCLTGRLPFRASGTLLETVAQRITQTVPSARIIRADLPVELDQLIARMTALKPSQRFQTPHAVMRALLPFVRSDLSNMPASTLVDASPGHLADANRPFDVLIVDDQRPIRDFCKLTLGSDEFRCDEAGSGVECLAAFQSKKYDLVLLDIDMPDMTGLETLKHLRANPPVPNLKVIMFSGRASSDEMAQAMLDGADDYLTKPFSCTQLQARTRAALRLKISIERADLLNRYLREANRDLERGLAERNHDLATARGAITAALSGVLLLRSTEPAAHLRRMRGYCKRLAEEASRAAPFVGQIDASFIENLDCCVAFHDIGMIGLPDHLVMKPGKFTLEERLLMQTHAAVGADMLQRISDEQGFAPDFFKMATSVARHHHERFDGSGYPSGLTGAAIPLAARIATIADVYDALRSRRHYKPPLSHQIATQVVTEGCPGHFDPDLIETLKTCAADFDQVFKESPDLQA
jgi:response regulator RpfG family c-di-GMP phosphodiesterase